MSATDEELVEAYYNCSNAAWNQLQQRHEARLLAYVTKRRRYVQEPAKAVANREIVNRVLLKAVETKFRDSGKFDPSKGTVAGWLQTICLNQIRDRSRAAPEVQANPDPEPPEPLPPDPSPCEEFLRDCIASLAPELRELTELKFFGALDQKEIAKMLNISPATVSRRFKNDIFPQLTECLNSKGIQV